MSAKISPPSLLTVLARSRVAATQQDVSFPTYRETQTYGQCTTGGSVRNGEPPHAPENRRASGVLAVCRRSGAFGHLLPENLRLPRDQRFRRPRLRPGGGPPAGAAPFQERRFSRHHLAARR